MKKPTAEPKNDVATLVAIEGAEIESPTPESPKAPAKEAPVAPAPPESGHALDRAPVNSKIVITRDGAWLATPDGVSALGKSDLARKLPNGAKITRTGPATFVAIQLDPSESHAPLETATAMAAILGFVPHFHGGEAVR